MSDTTQAAAAAAAAAAAVVTNPDDEAGDLPEPEAFETPAQVETEPDPADSDGEEEGDDVVDVETKSEAEDKEKKGNRSGNLSSNTKKKAFPQSGKKEKEKSERIKKSSEDQDAAADVEVEGDEKEGEEEQEGVDDEEDDDENDDLLKEVEAEKRSKDKENILTEYGFKPTSKQRPKGWAFRFPVSEYLENRRWRVGLFIACALLLIQSCIIVQITCLYYSMCYNEDDRSVGSGISNAIVPVAIYIIVFVLPQGLAASNAPGTFHMGVQFLLSTVATILLFIFAIAALARLGATKSDFSDAVAKDSAAVTLALQTAQSAGTDLSLSQKEWYSMSVREKRWFNTIGERSEESTSGFLVFENRMLRNATAAFISAMFVGATTFINSVCSGVIYLPVLRQKFRFCRKNAKSLPV
eukprot:g4359.t1